MLRSSFSPNSDAHVRLEMAFSTVHSTIAWFRMCVSGNETPHKRLLHVLYYRLYHKDLTYNIEWLDLCDTDN